MAAEHQELRQPPLEELVLPGARRATGEFFERGGEGDHHHRWREEMLPQHRPPDARAARM